MEIYADIVFFVNFCMDAFIFYISARLMKRRIRAIRLILGAIVTAALFCALMLFNVSGGVMGIILSSAILISGLVVVFPFLSVKELLYSAFLCHTVAFATGGIAMALVFYGNFPDVLGNTVTAAADGVSLKILIAATSGTYILYKTVIIIYKRYFCSQKAFHDICIYLNGRQSRVKALLDTGSELTEPISKSPVIVAEFDAVKGLLSPGFRDVFIKKNEDSLPDLLMGIADSNLSLRVRMVPYVSIGCQNGMLVGFKPDKIRFCECGQEERGFVIAVYNGKLGNGYNALCPYFEGKA